MGSLSHPRRTVPARTVRVGTSAAGGGYRIFVGPGLLRRLPRDLARGFPGNRRPPPGRVAIVSDSRVAALYGRTLLEDLRRLGLPAHLISFPRGESHKTRETKARLEDRLARLGFGRDGVIVALGGGVTGDLAGFLAATGHRGVPFIQAPTSLVAMLDASIGGKVAVDHPLAKNLIGAFHSPLAVYADTDSLATLPRREFNGGLAEAVKCGAIAKASLFRLIERHREAILKRDSRAVVRLVLSAADVKATIVSGDEREQGRRKLLNFGHTLGHALEWASGYRLRHGEAVSIGMVLESRLAVREGILQAGVASRIETLLRRLGLPTAVPRGLSAEAVLSAARRDKKARGGSIFFALPEQLGRHAGGPAWVVHVPDRRIRQILTLPDMMP